MQATYDHIGAGYEKYAKRATLKQAERATFVELVGPLRGERVLDVACGFGYYTRILKELGAGAVVGSDVSPEMIRLAREHEAVAPLGVEYVVAEGADLPDLPPSDLVTAVWLLNYAGSVGRLQSMLQEVRERLRPGGRFVAVTINPDFDLALGNMTPYGIEVLSDAPGANPPQLVGRFMTDPPSDEVVVDHWGRGLYESACAAAGLGELRWEPFRVPPALLAEYGEPYWRDFRRNCLATALSARRTG